MECWSSLSLPLWVMSLTIQVQAHCWWWHCVLSSKKNHSMMGPWTTSTWELRLVFATSLDVKITFHSPLYVPYPCISLWSDPKEKMTATYMQDWVNVQDVTFKKTAGRFRLVIVFWHRFSTIMCKSHSFSRKRLSCYLSHAISSTSGNSVYKSFC